MNNKVKIGIAFGLGAIGGAVASYFYLRKQFTVAVDQQMDSICNYYEENYIPKEDAKSYDEWSESQVTEVPVEEPEVLDETPVVQSSITGNATDKPPLTEYVDYAAKSKKYKTKSKKVDKPELYPEPCRITMNEFGMEEGYEVMGLYSFDDGIITTDQYEVLSEKDIHKYLGPKVLDTPWKEGIDAEDQVELDVIYIRNFELKTDFEIAFDCRRYDEVSELIKPHSIE